MKRKNVNLPPNLIYNDFAQFTSTHTHNRYFFRFFFVFCITFYFFSYCSSVPFFGWNLSIFLFYRYIKSTHSFIFISVYRTARYFVSLIEETLCFFFAASVYFPFFLVQQKCIHCLPKKKIAQNCGNIFIFVCFFLSLETISCLSIQSI